MHNYLQGNLVLLLLFSGVFPILIKDERTICQQSQSF